MSCHVIELTTQPGQVNELVEVIDRQALPQVIEPYEGFVDEIVLIADTEPNHVTSINFWRTERDAKRSEETGFAKLQALFQPLLSASPELEEFIVGASTDYRIVGRRT